MAKIKDFSKEKPEDLKPGRLVETTGTCKYCNNLVAIKADPDATEEEKDKIASSECSCKDAKDAQEVETSVRVLTDKINERYRGMTDSARHALISCIKPVAYGQLEYATFKVADGVSIKVYRGNKGVKLKRRTTEEDIMDEWSSN